MLPEMSGKRQPAKAGTRPGRILVTVVGGALVVGLAVAAGVWLRAGRSTAPSDQTNGLTPHPGPLPLEGRGRRDAVSSETYIRRTSGQLTFNKDIAPIIFEH